METSNNFHYPYTQKCIRTPSEEARFHKLPSWKGQSGSLLKIFWYCTGSVPAGLICHFSKEAAFPIVGPRNLYSLSASWWFGHSEFTKVSQETRYPPGTLLNYGEGKISIIFWNNGFNGLICKLCNFQNKTWMCMKNRAEAFLCSSSKARWLYLAQHFIDW